MTNKYTIAVPKNRTYKFYQRTFNEFKELYGIKLTENGEETTKILPISLNELVEQTDDKDNLYFELSENDTTNIFDEGYFTNDYLTSKDIKALANHCNFDLVKLEEYKNQKKEEVQE